MCYDGEPDWDFILDDLDETDRKAIAQNLMKQLENPPLAKMLRKGVIETKPFKPNFTRDNWDLRTA